MKRVDKRLFGVILLKISWRGLINAYTHMCDARTWHDINMPILAIFMTLVQLWTKIGPKLVMSELEQFGATPFVLHDCSGLASSLCFTSSLSEKKNKLTRVYLLSLSELRWENTRPKSRARIPSVYVDQQSSSYIHVSLSSYIHLLSSYGGNCTRR